MRRDGKKPETVEGLRNMVELFRNQSDFAKMKGAEALISGLVDVVEAQNLEIEKLKGAIYGNRA